MERARIRRTMDRRLARGCAEIRQRLEIVERRWEEDEQTRKREWEDLEGRLMTANEEHRHYNDGLLRKMAVMTEAHIDILRAFGEDVHQEFSKIAAQLDEGRAETRAQTEAILKMLDRLPPSN
jgi:predicted  nucleic acid-binding Zn-ribbon protein